MEEAAEQAKQDEITRQIDISLKKAAAQIKDIEDSQKVEDQMH